MSPHVLDRAIEVGSLRSKLQARPEGWTAGVLEAGDPISGRESVQMKVVEVELKLK